MFIDWNTFLFCFKAPLAHYLPFWCHARALLGRCQKKMLPLPLYPPIFFINALFSVYKSYYIRNYHNSLVGKGSFIIY